MTVWEMVGHEVDDFMTGIRTLRVGGVWNPQTVRNEINASFDFGTPVPLADLVARVAQLLRRYTTHVTHPRYFGLFNPSTGPGRRLVYGQGRHRSVHRGERCMLVERDSLTELRMMCLR